MAFEELKEHTENIQDQAQAYIESNVAYYKLRGFKVAMKSTTTIFKIILIGLGLSMVLLFCSIAGAFVIGKYLNSYALGFLIIAGVYLILTGLIYFNRDKIVEAPILGKFSEIFFND